MQIFEEKTYTGFQATEVALSQTLPSVGVVSISESEYLELTKHLLGNALYVHWDTLYAPKAGQNIINEGASPCLIVYAKNTQTGQLITGHFTTISIRGDQGLSPFLMKEIFEENRTDQKLQRPSIGLTQQFQKLPGIEHFLATLSHWIQDSQTPKVEVYLFGQNFYEPIRENDDISQVSLREILTRFRDRVSITSRLLSLGIAQKYIFDYRTNDTDMLDSAIFLAEANIIAHKHVRIQNYG